MSQIEEPNTSKQNVSQLRKTLTNPQTNPEIATKEWAQQAEQAELRYQRMELKLLLGLLERVAFSLPLKLQVYQIYYQGFLQEMDADYLKASEYYRQGLELIQGQFDFDLLATMFKRGLGHCLVQKGDSEQAEQLLQAALPQAQTPGYRLVEANLYRTLGYCYYKMGKIDKSIEYCQHGIKISKELGNTNGVAAAHNTLGLCYIASDRLEEGRQALEYAAELRKSLGNSRDLGIIYLNLGLIHEKLGEYKLAVEAAQMAVTLSGQIGNQPITGVGLLNLTLYYTNLGEFDKALEAGSKAIQIFRELGEQGFLLAALANKAIAYGAVGKIAEARDYLGQAEQLLEEVRQKKNNLVLATLYTNLNSATIQIATTPEDFSKAFSYREAGLALFEQLNDHYAAAGLCDQEARALLKSTQAAKYKQTAFQDMQKCWHYFQKITNLDYSKMVEPLLLYAELLSDEGFKEQSFEIYSLAFKHLSSSKTKQDRRKLVEHYSKAAKLTTSDKAIPLIEKAMELLKAENGDPARLKELFNQVSLLRKQQPKGSKWFPGKNQD